MTKLNELTHSGMEFRDGVLGVFVTNETTGEVKWIPDPGQYAPEGWRAATVAEVETLSAENAAWAEGVN